MGSIPVTGTYSASRVSAVVGVNSYKTQLEAWQELIEEIEPGYNAAQNYTLPEKPDSAAIRWGHAFEDAVIKLAEGTAGLNIINREKVFLKEFSDIVFSCHIDGEFEECLPHVLHEGKTTNFRAFTAVKEEKCRWGEPGTDQVPEEYQIQAAVQRICTGAELVKLSVLVFPKSVDEFEKEGWMIIISDNKYRIQKNNDIGDIRCPFDWAETLSEMGYFHTYNLPKNVALEEAVIKSVHDFHERYVVPRIPPKCQNYDDVRRLLTNPVGTVIADDELKAMAREYSEITRQLGNSGPLAKRREFLKVKIMNQVMTTKKDDWADPPDKIIVVDPIGGDILVNFSTSGGFRAVRAK